MGMRHNKNVVLISMYLSQVLIVGFFCIYGETLQSLQNVTKVATVNIGV